MQNQKPTDRGAIASLLMLALLGCGSPTSTGTLTDGGVADLSAGVDLRGATDMGSQPDLPPLNCKGTETFQQARTAMLSSCSGFAQFSCHGRTPFSGGLDLTAANAYKDLVGVPAMIAPTKLRVKPGDSAASFVVQKLTDTQGANEGGPMPEPVEGLMWSPPNPTALATLRCWIQNGALNN